jgi:hypothetical protein
MSASVFNLAVVSPVKGKAGTLMFTRSVKATDISSAVKQVRAEVEGTGFLVMQESAYMSGKYPMNTITAALHKAYTATGAVL